MARLPVDVAELSNRNELPTGAMQVQEATARNMGGLQAGALASLGDAVSGLALKIEANKRQSAGFDIEQQFIALQEEDARAYEESKRGLAGSGEGFWEASRKASSERYDAWVDGLPKWAQDEYRTKVERKKAERSNQAFGDQYTQQDNNTRNVLTEEERKAGVSVQENPESFEEYRQRQFDLIDKSTLPAAEKEARKLEITNALAATAAESDAVNRPGEVLTADVAAQGDWLKYSNQNAVRNDPLDARLVAAMSFVKDMGVTMDVISGGQESNKPGEGTGSTRHNHGMSADVDFYKNGRKLDWNNPADLPILVQIVQQAKANGITGIGAGDDYMGAGRFHMGFGSAAVWGAGGKGANAPQWLVDAYNGVDAGSMPTAEAASGFAVKPAYMEHLNADQVKSYYRTAEASFDKDMRAAQAIADAQRAASQDAALLGITEGPDPQGAYDKARSEGLFGTAEEVKRVNAALQDRQKKDGDTARGQDIMSGAVPASRMDADDRKAVNSWFKGAVDAGVDAAEAARSAFRKTGIVPPDFAKGLIGGANSNDPARVGEALRATANLLGLDANAFTGVDNSGKLVDDANEFRRRTEILGESADDAVKAILADRARPALSAAAQEEALRVFRKDQLTPEKIEAGLAAAAENGWGTDARVPVGELTGGDAMRAIFKGYAEEGFRKFSDADRAMDYAATEMGRRFGVWNGTLTQYPPDKAGVPALPNADDPYAWVAEQAAADASEALGGQYKPEEIVLVPVEERGVSTRAAFTGTPMAVPGQPGKFSTPYRVVILPQDGGAPMVAPGVFLPDINKYVADKNATMPPADPLPRRGIGLGVGYQGVTPETGALQTPDQAAAEAQAKLNSDRYLAEQEAKRQAELDKVRNSRYSRFKPSSE